MGVVVAFMVVLFGAIGMVVYQATRSAAARKRSSLNVVASHLDAPGASTSNSVTGVHRSFPLTFTYGTRGVGSSTESWTFIEITLSRRPPFSLALRPQHQGENVRKSRGLALDLEVGDRTFDDAFIVEGAPSDLVLALLDGDLRQRVMACRPLELEITPGKIAFARAGWLEDGLGIERAIDLVTRLAEKIPVAIEEADAKIEERVAGPAFRQDPDAGAERAAKATRAAELKALDDVKQRRAEDERLGRNRALLLVLVLFAVSIGIGAIGVINAMRSP